MSQTASSNATKEVTTDATSDNTQQLTRDEGIAKLAELLQDIRITMLTTLRPDGSLHSRPMAAQNNPFNGEVVFLTGGNSPKVEEIADDAEVSLTYTDSKSTYVTMTGRARISNDRALITALFNPMYKAWFPEGESDPNIRVLRIPIEHAEYWDAPSSALVRNVKILARAATGGKTPVGDHAHVSL